MKKTIIVLFILISNLSFSQKSGFEYAGRFNPSVKQEKLYAAVSISDLLPGLWNKLGLSYEVREELEHRRKMDSEQGCAIFYPDGYNYNRIIEYVSVEISVTGSGKTMIYGSSGEALTSEQKAVLKTAVPGTDFSIKIKFRYKNRVEDHKSLREEKILEGGLVVTIIPEVEAEYPGGFKQLTAYLIENVISKISEKEFTDSFQRAAVQFTIDKEGRVVDAEVIRTSADARIDKLLLDAVRKMPKWKPAKDSKGVNVFEKQNISFGEGC